MYNLEPGLSVIVPIYNVEKYVEKSIRSILNSKLKYLKVIVIDDHGTDRSMKIVENLAKVDSRISIFHNDKNRGLAYSRNHGIEKVTTTYMAFLDSDDWVCPGFYDLLMDSAIHDDSDIAAGQVIYSYPKSGKEQYGWVSYWSFLNQKKILSNSHDKQNIIFACACWNKIYRTSLIHKYGLRFPINLYIEDIPFTFLTTALANKISVVKEAKLYYLQRSNSIMKSLKTSKRVFDIFQVMKITYSDLHKLPIEMRANYKQILDHFWIFNLINWSSQIEAPFQQDFEKTVRNKLSKINPGNNPYIFGEHLQIYLTFMKTPCKYNLLLFNRLQICTITKSWLTE